MFESPQSEEAEIHLINDTVKVINIVKKAIYKYNDIFDSMENFNLSDNYMLLTSFNKVVEQYIYLLTRIEK